MYPGDVAKTVSGAKQLVTADGPQQPVMQGLMDRLDQAIQEARNNADRLRQLCDRAFGEQPSEVDKTCPRAVPVGVTGALEERCADLFAALAVQNQLINRLYQFV